MDNLCMLLKQGARRSDINVELRDDLAIIKGKFGGKLDTSKFTRSKWTESERYRGEFCREIGLPSSVQADKITAMIENGILEVRLPKAEPVIKNIEV